MQELKISVSTVEQIIIHGEEQGFIKGETDWLISAIEQAAEEENK